MVYDAAHHVVLMYGGASDLDTGVGCGETGPYVRCFQDTWTWDGIDWKELHPAHTPGLWGTIAFDDSTNSVLFYDSKTWNWSGTDWIKVGAPQGPQPVAQQAMMAFDPATGGVIQFGGIDLSGTIHRTEMWRWNGTAWIALSAQAPNFPVGSPICGDKRPNVVIGYKAATYTGTAANQVMQSGSETWQWNGTQWTRLNPAHEPDLVSARLFADPVTGGLLLVGANDIALAFDEWTWNGADWNSVS
jgi:hypothetical protein